MELTTASDYLEQHPPRGLMALPEGSWGQGGTHFTWDNVDTQWMWPPIHDAERRMEQLTARYATASGPIEEIIRWRAELLLLQSSDWPFLVTTGQAKEYAIHAVPGASGPFQPACTCRGTGLDRRGYPGYMPGPPTPRQPLPSIDYRWFAPRQGQRFTTAVVV